MKYPLLCVLACILGIVMLAAAGPSAQAATASLAYAVGPGFVDEILDVTLESSNSEWTSADFHADHIGVGTNTIYADNLAPWGPYWGGGTYSYPGDGSYIQFYDLPGGSYDIYAIAHGATVTPPDFPWDPPTSTPWDASTGGQNVTVPSP